MRQIYYPEVSRSMSSPREKLQELLRELFQFESADLDFGIYRIMNFKRDAIERFIQKDLIEAVDKELASGMLASQSQAALELKEVAAQIRETLGEEALNGDGTLAKDFHNTKVGKRYLEFQARASQAQEQPALEATTFNHLYAFFSRYYDSGDFLSKRRYSRREKYAVPYNGEEVYLHWANNDQYYVKTGEYFNDYRFKSPYGISVHFVLIAADVEKDNIKGDKRFFVPVSQGVTFDVENKEITIPFQYRPLTEQEDIKYGQRNQQDAIITEALNTIPAELKKSVDALPALVSTHHTTSDGQQVSFLENHLRRYIRRNTSDFFVHKDLKGFLTRELDFYLKNEVLNLDNMEAAGEPRCEAWFQIMHVIRSIGSRVIEFLTQIEDFQKRLFEKRKFILETQYCITMANVPEDFYAEIAECEAQWQEWKELFHLDEEQPNLFTSTAKNQKECRIATLSEHPTLVLDTKHFDQQFKDRLLANFENLDEMTDGLLIHGENFQALNILLEKYRENVQCIYIDPPYNTGASQILYKNDYKDSSWLCLMENRIRIARWFMRRDSVMVVAIDDNGIANLSKLIEIVFPNYEIQRVVVNHYPGSGTGRSNISRTHEYAMFVVPNEDVLKGEEKVSGVRERPFRRSGTGENNYRTGRPNSFYAVLVDPVNVEIKGFEPPPVSKEYPQGKTPEGLVRVYPIGENGSERVWSLSYESADPALKDGLLKCTPNLTINRLVRDENRRSLLPSVWVDKKFNAVSYGTNLLTDILGSSGLFSYPKSLYTVSAAVDAITCTVPESVVLDFFAGSGTTGHAVISLNRDDHEERRFVLIDFAEYFDTVLLPRIKKVTYTPEWKNGKPARLATADEAEYSPRIVKYIRLESYEDTLNNITFPDVPKALYDFDDYLLKYMLAWETKESETLLNVDKLANPFSYKLTITGDEEVLQKPVDIPETFAYLLGLNIKTRRVYQDKERRYLVYRGNIDHREIVVIWRETAGWEKADYERDKQFVEEQKLTEGVDEVFVNGDSYIPKARALESVFKGRMFGSL
jgi:adenine-specific DNA-methyltransferase